MKKTYSFDKCDHTKNCITFHPATLQRLQLGSYMRTIIKYGSIQTNVLIKTSNRLKSDQVLLSANLLKKLHLPLQIAYEININNSEIHIGPFIGIIIGRTDEEVKRRLSALLDYVNCYPKINGAVIAFSADQIQPNSTLLHGYLFDPIDKKWITATFNYPAAVILRTFLSTPKRNLLQKYVNNRIINSHVYDKWECYQIFTPLKSHVPSTFLYHEPNQIFNLLEQYMTLYIKPINSYGGYKICKISLNEDSTITLTFNRKTKNKSISFHNKQRAKKYFLRLFSSEKWILQESVNLISYDSCKIDFRCIVVKEKNGTWGVSSVIGRYGPPTGIVSNIHSGGRAEMGLRTLMKTLHLTKSEATMHLDKLSQLALEAVQLLEASGGQFGTMGVDIAIDQNLKHWLIEVNHRIPAHDIALDAGNVKLYYRITEKIMLYVKELAGF